MNIVEVYARNTDGTIAHVFTPSLRGTPEAGTTMVARFDATAYPQHYNSINSNGQYIHFVDGALLLDTHPIYVSQVVADAAWILARKTEVEAAEFEGAQVNTARTTLQTLMSGLGALNAADKGFAIYGRIFAFRNGANQTVIDGITNKATAQAYITGLPEWQALPVASKAFFAKELEANAGLCTALLLILTG